MKLVIVTIVAFACSSAISQEIKGIELGMSVDQFNKMYPKGSVSITIGNAFNIGPSTGADGKYNKHWGLEFKDGKLRQFIFRFHLDSFKYVKAAVLGKYPDTKCNIERYPFSDEFGRPYYKYNEVCVYGTLRLIEKTDILNPLAGGELAITESGYLEKAEDEKINKAKKDI